MARRHEQALWKLYARAVDILDGGARGDARPILRALALRRFAPAENELSKFVGAEEALALLRRAARRGDQVSRYNLAIEHRNRGDMAGYRRLLADAARGDADARDELRQFRTRFPYACMKRFRRLMPAAR
jgi:hypothetical protein